MGSSDEFWDIKGIAGESGANIELAMHEFHPNGPRQSRQLMWGNLVRLGKEDVKSGIEYPAGCM